MSKQAILKFVKGFITGGLSAVVAALAIGVSVHSLEDVRGLAVLVATAFVSGSIHAIVEMLKPTLPATTVSVITQTIPTQNVQAPLQDVPPQA